MYFEKNTRTDIMSSREEVQKSLNDYWDKRAKGYSLATMLTLNTGGDELETKVGTYVDLSRSLKILDVGSGAGLVALTFARLGHEVTAVETSQTMIWYARRNAKALDLDVKFFRMDAHHLTFKDDEFDLVIMKDVLWMLSDPMGAYSECLRVLKPGGNAVVMDGNYYLYLKDEEYADMRGYLLMKNGPDCFHSKTNIDHVDLETLVEIAKGLPLTSKRRPAWDVSALTGLGIRDIRVICRDTEPYSRITEHGKAVLPRLFMLCFRKDNGDKFVSVSSAAKMQSICEGEDVGQISNLLRIVGNEVRLRILTELYGKESNVNQLSASTGYSQSLLSHNLKDLKDARLVVVEQRGRESFYRVRNKAFVNRLIEICSNHIGLV